MEKPPTGSPWNPLRETMDEYRLRLDRERLAAYDEHKAADAAGTSVRSSAFSRTAVDARHDEVVAKSRGAFGATVDTDRPMSEHDLHRGGIATGDIPLMGERPTEQTVPRAFADKIQISADRAKTEPVQCHTVTVTIDPVTGEQVTREFDGNNLWIGETRVSREDMASAPSSTLPGRPLTELLPGFDGLRFFSGDNEVKITGILDETGEATKAMRLARAAVSPAEIQPRELAPGEMLQDVSNAHPVDVLRTMTEGLYDIPDSYFAELRAYCDEPVSIDPNSCDFIADRFEIRPDAFRPDAFKIGAEQSTDGKRHSPFEVSGDGKVEIGSVVEAEPQGLMLVIPPGEGAHVRLYDMATGNDILQTLHAKSMKVDVDGQGRSKLTVELAIQEVSGSFDQATYLALNPATDKMQRLASMTFADGTIVSLPDNGVPVVARRGRGE